MGHVRRSLGVCFATIAVAGSARAGGPEFTKGPYIQALGPRSVVVKWEASEASPGVIVVRGPSGAPREIKTSEKTEFHAVDVAGLEPKTPYTYEVKVGDAKGVEGKFVTAPDGDEPFSFLTYGDSRDDHAAHEAIVRRMQQVPSDFLVNTGDMVGEGDSSSDWRMFFRIEGAMLRDRAVFACVGNHELTGAGSPPWLRYFHPGVAKGDNRKGLFHTARWGNTRFFLLNAMVPWETGDDVTWIQDELSRAESEPGLAHRIVVMHHGPSSSGPHGPNETLRRMKINELFRNKKVDLVLAGHDHFYERGELDGLRYIVTGGAGAPLYPKKRLQSSTMAIETAHHFVEVKVAGPKISFVARRVDGSVLEECAIESSGFACSTALPSPRRPEPDNKASPTGPKPAPKKSDCDCSTPGARVERPWGALALAPLAWVARRRRRGVVRGRW